MTKVSALMARELMLFHILSLGAPLFKTCSHIATGRRRRWAIGLHCC